MNCSDTYSLNSDPGKKTLPYVRGNKLFLLFICVVAFHVLMIILPFFILKLSDLINPPLSVEQVSLVDSPPNDNDIPTEFPSAQNPVNEGIPPPGEEKPAELPALPDVPILPDLPEIKQQEEKVDTKQEKEITAEPEKQEKTTEKKIEKKAEKKQSKYVSPQDIKISKKRVKRTASTPANRKKTGKSEAEIRAQRIRDLLNAYRNNSGRKQPSGSPYGREGGTGKAGGAGGPKGVTSSRMNEYYEQVRNFLMRSWQQPNTALLNNSRPEVLVLISVDASGRITSAKILRKSGNSAMDSSVAALLEDVKVLPKPPRAMQFTVTVNIE